MRDPAAIRTQCRCEMRPADVAGLVLHGPQHGVDEALALILWFRANNSDDARHIRFSPAVRLAPRRMCSRCGRV